MNLLTAFAVEQLLEDTDRSLEAVTTAERLRGASASLTSWRQSFEGRKQSLRMLLAEKLRTKARPVFSRAKVFE